MKIIEIPPPPPPPPHPLPAIKFWEKFLPTEGFKIYTHFV